MVQRILSVVVDLQLRDKKFGRQGALQNTSCKGWVGPFDHAIQVHCWLSLHGVLDLVQLLSHVFHHLITTTSWLHGMFGSIPSAILWTIGLVIIVIAITSRLWHSRIPRACPSLQFFIPFHQFLHVSSKCLNLLGHYGGVRRRWWSGSFHVFWGALLVKIWRLA